MMTTTTPAAPLPIACPLCGQHALELRPVLVVEGARDRMAGAVLCGRCEFAEELTVILRERKG